MKETVSCSHVKDGALTHGRGPKVTVFLLLEISCPGPCQSQSWPRGAHHQRLSSAQHISEGRSRNVEQTFWKTSGQLGETGKLLELLSRGSVLDMMDVMMGTGREDREKLQWISSMGPGPRFLTHQFWWMQTYSGQSIISKFIKLWLKEIKKKMKRCHPIKALDIMLSWSTNDPITAGSTSPRGTLIPRGSNLHRRDPVMRPRRRCGRGSAKTVISTWKKVDKAQLDAPM